MFDRLYRKIFASFYYFRIKTLLSCTKTSESFSVFVRNSRALQARVTRDLNSYVR